MSDLALGRPAAAEPRDEIRAVGGTLAPWRDRSIAQDLRALYDHRLYIFRNAWNNLVFRYAGTGAGVLWILINPLLQVVIFTVVFKELFGLRPELSDSRSIPFSMYLCAGLVPWLSFSEALTRGGEALSEKAAYLRCLSVPNQVYVAESVMTASFGSATSLVLMLAASAFFGGAFGLTWLAVPILVLMLQVIAFALSLILAHLRVFFPDVGELVRLLLQLSVFIVPIVYRPEAAPTILRPLSAMNPPYLVIRGLRQVVLEGTAPPALDWLVIVCWTCALLLCGLLVSRMLAPEVRDVV